MKFNMLFKQLALAATAAAFLVVPEVSEADKDIVQTLPIDVETTQQLPSIATAQSVSVPCKQCKGKDTHVQMDFVVEDGSRLMLNGFELYPTADPWHGDLVASVVKGNGKEKEQTLGYSLSVKPEAVDMEQRLELVSIQLRVIEIGRHFVDGMPTVKAMLIKAPSGDIVIGSVNVEEVTEKSYDSTLLRIKEKVEKFWKNLKGGCTRNKQSVHDVAEGELVGGEHPHHGARPWRPNHHHGHQRHNWGKLLKNIAANILLPVLAGITAGVGVAVFAMGLCSCVALVFHARRRRCRRTSRASRTSRRGARRSKAAATEPAVVEEKVGLMEAQDLPPEYEEDEQAN